MFRDPKRNPAARRFIGTGTVVLALSAALLLAPGLTLAANTTPVTNTTNAHPKLVAPASTGEAKTSRQALLKQRKLAIVHTTAHPGKTAGGTLTPRPKTVMTKRILPK